MPCWAKDHLSFDPTRVNPDDLHYLAGLFDGEGCVTVQGGRRAGITIGMTHEPTIQWLQATFGGRVSKQQFKTSVLHRWELTRVADLEWLLPRLAPLTRLKKERLKAAFRLVEFTKDRPGLKSAQLAEWNATLPSVVAPLRAGYYSADGTALAKT